MDNASPAVGDRLELTVERAANQGVFVARHEGRVIFLPGVIPGERVLAEVVEVKAAFVRAVPFEILETSPHRVVSEWDEARWQRGIPGVGGAEYSHIALPEQRRLKAELLAENLQRFAKLSEQQSAVPVEALDAGDGWHYRTRARLAIAPGGELGQYRERTHEIIPLRNFPLLVPELASLGLAAVRHPGEEFLELAASSTGQLQWQTQGQKHGPDHLIERIGELEFRVSRGGFWQVHRAAAASLARLVSDLAQPGLRAAAHNLDLYGGVGLFALAIAGTAGGGIRFEIVESNRGAVSDANHNAKQLPGVRATRSDSPDFVRRLTQVGSLRGALVVVDPPRAGLGLKTAGALAALKPRQLIYVACDSVSLARDLPSFLEAGYRIERLKALDLFPQTHHFETVANLILD